MNSRTVYTISLIAENLRGHTDSQEATNFDVDLKALYIKKPEMERVLVIPGSSLKGLIRRNLKTLGVDRDIIESLLGSEFNDQTERSIPGKVFIGWGYIVGEKPKRTRYGIRVNDKLGIVNKGALFSYELLLGDIEVMFDIYEVVPLKDEKRELARALKLLKFSTIGWGGSRGIGIVTEVKLDDRLEKI
ncbi:hypothetical protein CM19_13065 [Candidatus Acidianus copahuensis]|uniref:CRISPR type III-associated protein domain-containing protein n=1 Tax=Candidatus Acidianus copahuensis TaxID=1160895 RepID=A0A031LHB2_9CREN|nr:RAMP superfamily CRISPR-associated protein [Candidatus Acidianus copahuensis]EZQ01542.1 hypothetical protein CM19_13065 [Candidatus Acidianus copahuensis]